VGCDELNFENQKIDGTGHFDSITVVLGDSVADPDHCGDLDFDGRHRTFWARLATQSSVPIPEENPHKYLWLRGRNRETGSTDAVYQLWYDTASAGRVVETGTLSVPLDQDWDAAGVVLITINQGSLEPTDSAFLYAAPSYGPEGRINYRLQHWRHVAAPVLDSSRQGLGLTVTLYWQNRHEGRPLDSTIVFRGSSWIRTLGPTVTSWPDTVPAEGTYVYRLKHITMPAMIHGGLALPNSEASNPDTVIVALPDPLSMFIDGPDLITADSLYEWSMATSEGTPPYIDHLWEYQAFGTSTWTSVGHNANYSRYVYATDPWFWLRAAVWDSGTPQDSVVNRKLAVETWDGGGGGAAPLAQGVQIGVRLRDGRCSARPAVGDPGRQAWLQMIMTTVERIEYCRLEAGAS